MQPYFRAISSAAVAAALLAFYSSNYLSAAESRKWTSQDGKTINAAFVSADAGFVVLHMNGRDIRVPVTRFSESDQQFIRDSASKTASAIPATDAAKSDPAKPDTAAPNAAATDANKPDADKSKSEPAKSDKPDAKAAAAATAELAKVRMWTDNQGKTVRGKFERISGQQVVIKGSGLRPLMVPYTNLSSADQDFLRTQLEAKGQGAMLPMTVASIAAGDIADNPAMGEPRGSNPGVGSRPNFGPGNQPLGPRSRPGFPDRPQMPEMRMPEIRMPEMPEIKMPDMKMPDMNMPTRQAHNFPTASRPSPFDMPTANHSSGGASPTSVASSSPVSSTPIYTPPAYDAVASSSSSTEHSRFPTGPRHAPPVFTQAPTAQTTSVPSPAPEPQMEMGKMCSGCRKEVPSHIKAGDHCPHCGVYFNSEEDERGRTVKTAPDPWYSTRSLKQIFLLVMVVIGIIGGLINKLRG